MRPYAGQGIEAYCDNSIRQPRLRRSVDDGSSAAGTKPPRTAMSIVATRTRRSGSALAGAETVREAFGSSGSRSLQPAVDNVTSFATGPQRIVSGTSVADDP